MYNVSFLSVVCLTPLNTFNVALNATTQSLYGLNDWKIGQTEDDQKRNEEGKKR